MENTRIELLGRGVSAVISKEHGFSTDALLLADFASPSPRERCCDMGSGCGIIPLLWCRGERRAGIAAVEISEAACGQLERAVEISSLQGKIDIYNRDLREVKDFLPAGEFDLVTMNPPYKAAGAGIESRDAAARIARHAVACTLDDVCASAARLLRFGGRFCVCLRPERLCELLLSMSSHAIEPKRLCCVAKREGERPWLILVQGKRGSKSGMTVEAQLNVYDENGEYSAYMRSLYRDYELAREENMKRREAEERI